MSVRKIEKTEAGFDLILAGPSQYLTGKDAILSELYQKLLLIKGELTFDFPDFQSNEGLGLPVFSKLSKFELDLEIKKIILSVDGIDFIRDYTSSVVAIEDKETYSARATLVTREGDIQWEMTR